MEPIFAGKLSLTDDIPEQSQASGGRFKVVAPPFQQKIWSRSAADQARFAFDYIKDTYGQPQPLPEPGLSPAAQRVRAEAARLGINYDAEVTKVLHRMKGNGLAVAPNPWNKQAGADPLKNVSDEARYQAEKAAVETIKRERGVQLTWED